MLALKGTIHPLWVVVVSASCPVARAPGDHPGSGTGSLRFILKWPGSSWRIEGKGGGVYLVVMSRWEVLIFEFSHLLCSFPFNLVRYRIYCIAGYSPVAIVKGFCRSDDV